MERSPEAVLEPIDVTALHIIKLIGDLDGLITAMKSWLPVSKPWQRQLRALLIQADLEMQVLRMIEAMQKPDADMMEAAAKLAYTCRQISSGVQGSRADAVVRSAAKTIGKIGDALAKLMRREVQDV